MLTEVNEVFEKDLNRNDVKKMTRRGSGFRWKLVDTLEDFGVYRYLVLTLTLLTLAISLSCFICFNVAIVHMTNLETSPYYDSNITDPYYYSNPDIPMSQRRFVFSPQERGWIFASPFVGCCLLAIPVAMSMRIIGTRYTQLIVGVLTAVITFVTPWLMTSLNFWIFFVFRLLHGASLANLYPVIGVVVPKWAPIHEKGFFVSTLTGYLQLSCVIAMPLAGVLVVFVSWPVVFYVHGVLALCLFLLWFFLFTNDPSTNRFIKKTEVILIKKDKPQEITVVNVPYLQIFTTPSVIAVYVAVFGNFITFNFANTFFPAYLHNLFNLSSLDSSLISAAVLSAQFIVKVITGLVMDRLTLVKESKKVKWSNSLAFCGTATLLIVASVVPISWNAWAILAIAAPYVVLGANGGGFPKSALLISGQHTPTIMAAFQVMLCASFLISSVIVPLITPNNTFEEWRLVFLLYAFLLITCNGIFIAFCSVTPAKWAKPENKPSNGGA